MKKFFSALLSLCLLIGACFMGAFQGIETNTASAASLTETAAEIIVNPQGYSSEERLWQGIPGVEVTKGGRLWVSYFTGGEKEPSTENCVAFAYSDDDGRTWNDPFFIIAHPSDGARTYDPCVWLDPLGRMWFTWCQARGSYSDLKNWAIVLENPDATETEMKTALEKATPRLLGDGVKLNKMTVLNSGDWLFFTASSTPTAITVWASTDSGATWSVRSLMSGNGYRVTEPMAVQLADGKIMLMTRIEKVDGVLMGGGIGYSISSDNGKTWSDYQADLPKPLRGPSSRFALVKLQSGNLLFVNNDSETGRTKMTAYLSTDNGESWRYSCLLDERTEVSYPCVAQDKDGNIYVTYDKGRYIEKEIRITKFTEQDIMNGKIASEGSVVRMAVSILGDQMDIESVSTEFTKAITVERGTLLSTARKDLPTTIKVKDKDGNEYTLSGKWGTEDYDAEKAGTYTLTFSATTDMLRYKLFDAHNLLQVTVIVKGNGSGDDGDSGCAGSISAGAIGGLLLAGAIILTRKNKNKNYKEDKR